MKKFVFFLLITIFSPALKAQKSDVVDRYNRTAFELYHLFLQSEKNSVFSPFLVINNLSAAYMAANSYTYLQMANFLDFPVKQDEFLKQYKSLNGILAENNNLSTRLEATMSVWLEDSLKEYIVDDRDKQIAKELKNDVLYIDFTKSPETVSKMINLWFKRSTLGGVEPINKLEPVKGGMLLVSSGFFTGNWQNNFTSIYKAPFYLDKYGRRTKSLEYLTVNDYFKVADGEDFQVIEIPYENNKMSLMIILPHKDLNLGDIQQKINYDEYQLVEQGLNLQRVRIFLPILDVKSQYTLKDSLSKYMPTLFSRKANLTRMFRKLVWVDEAYHSMKFSIEPETMLPSTRFLSFDDQAGTRTIFINRPFVFFVKDNRTGAIVLFGHVFKPNVY